MSKTKEKILNYILIYSYIFKIIRINTKGEIVWHTVESLSSFKKRQPLYQFKSHLREHKTGHHKKHTASIRIHKSISVFVLQADFSSLIIFLSISQKMFIFLEQHRVFPLFLIFYYSTKTNQT